RAHARRQGYRGPVCSASSGRCGQRSRDRARHAREVAPLEGGRNPALPARELERSCRRERLPRRNDMKRWLDGWRGVALLFAVALVVYGIEALAWPLQRGRDSWDYWLYYLQFADRHPVFWAVQLFRTPVTPLVTGIPMTISGARLLEAVMGVIYAAAIVGWAWA